MPVMTWHPYLGNQRCYWSRSSLQGILKHTVRFSYNTIWSQCVQEDTCRAPKAGLSGFSNFWNCSRRSRARVVGVRTTLFPQTAVLTAICSASGRATPTDARALSTQENLENLKIQPLPRYSYGGFETAHVDTSEPAQSTSVFRIVVSSHMAELRKPGHPPMLGAFDRVFTHSCPLPIPQKYLNTSRSVLNVPSMRYRLYSGSHCFATVCSAWGL